MPDVLTPTAPRAATRAPAGPWLVFAVIAVGVFMAQLDLFIVNVAFPAIERDFAGSSNGSLSWVLNAYAVVFAACLVPAGRLGDLLGRRRTFELGLAVFALGSLGCAAASSLRGARRRPRRAGRRRRADRPHVARAADARLPGRAASGSRRRVGRGRLRRGRQRRAARRVARRDRLAADLPRQPAARRRRADRGAPARSRGPPPRDGRAPRPGGDRAAGRRRGRSGAVHRRRAGLGLGQPGLRRRDAGGAGRARRVPPALRDAPHARGRALAPDAAAVRRRQRRDVPVLRRLRGDAAAVRAVPDGTLGLHAADRWADDRPRPAARRRRRAQHQADRPAPGHASGGDGGLAARRRRRRLVGVAARRRTPTTRRRSSPGC